MCKNPPVPPYSSPSSCVDLTRRVKDVKFIFDMSFDIAV